MAQAMDLAQQSAHGNEAPMSNSFLFTQDEGDRLVKDVREPEETKA